MVLGAAVIVFGSLHLGPLLPAMGLELVPEIPFPAVLPSVVLTGLVLVTLHVAGFYDLREPYGRTELGLRVVLAFVPPYMAIGALAFLAPTGGLGRWVYISSFSAGVVLMIGWRLVIDRFEADLLSQRQVLLLGAGRTARLIADVMATRPRRYRLLGCVEGLGATDGQADHGLPIAGSTGELEWILKVQRPDMVVVATEERRGVFPLETILACKIQGTEVEDWPTFYEKVMGKIRIADLPLSWLIFSDGFRTTRMVKTLKRVIDAAVAVPASALTALLTPLLALLIKLESPGPVFYRQERVGESGRIFWLVKFRTMRHDAERDTGPVWAGENDPRITRIGRFLRKTRLDEFPQFFNILKGEMSLVGPRPERPAFVAQLQEQIPFYTYRHSVKPGITGWAQVRYPYGASLEGAREKLQYELYYIKNMSIFLDLLIIVQTIQVVLLRRGSR